MLEPPIDWRGNAFRRAAPFLFTVVDLLRGVLCRRPATRIVWAPH